jgi:hypothetical protein
VDDFDLDGDLESYDELDADGAAELEERLAALERRGGVEAAFRAVMREELDTADW